MKICFTCKINKPTGFQDLCWNHNAQKKVNK